jgi:predicted Zn-dependent protease
MIAMDIDDITKMLEVGDDAGARHHLLDLVERDPASEGAWLFLVGIGFRSNDAELSLWALRALEKLRPRDVLVASGLVDCLLQLERYEQAKKAIETFSKVARPGMPAHDTVLEEHRRALQFIHERMEKGSDDGR